MNETEGPIGVLLDFIRTAFGRREGAAFLVFGSPVYMTSLDHFDGATDPGILLAVVGKGAVMITDPKVNKFTLVRDGIPLRIAEHLAPVIRHLLVPVQRPATGQNEALSSAALRIEDHGSHT